MSNQDQLIKLQNYHHVETVQLICRANQLTGFYMMTTLVFNEFNLKLVSLFSYI